MKLHSSLLLLGAQYVSAVAVASETEASSLVAGHREPQIKASDPLNKYTKLFGAGHGVPFSEERFTHADGRITTITLKGCGTGEHLGTMSVDYRYLVDIPASPKTVKPAIQYATAAHGSTGGKEAKLELQEGEYIKQVDLTTREVKTGIFHASRRTRIGSIKLTTNRNQVVSCGASSSTDPNISWKFDNYALLYFEGSAGDAIDALSANFIRVDKFY